jgi:UDP-N-acetylmuramate dehydrogenase
VTSDLEVAAAVLGGRAERDAPLGTLTTYRVGGPAALLVRAADVDDLRAVAAARQRTDLPLLVVGNGSNLLVADRGFRGLVVVLGEAFAGVEVDGTSVRAGGRALLPVVARRTVAAGLTGFEWAVGVPGTVGGAVRMNAGGHGADMAASLAGVRVLDLVTGQDETVHPDRLDLGYRHSAIGPHQVVIEAGLALAEGDREASEAEMSAIVRWRREHQPGGPNAGSVFANPEGESAGRLIDSAGAKGLRIGTAMVSTKHANFIQADVDGRAADVLAVMAAVAEKVRVAAGVRLRPETRLAGFSRRELPLEWLDLDPQLLIES